MDRIGASVLRTAESIKSKLNTEPIVMQYPIGEEDTLSGVINLCEM